MEKKVYLIQTKCMQDRIYQNIPINSMTRLKKHTKQQQQKTNINNPLLKCLQSNNSPYLYEQLSKFKMLCFHFNMM